MEGIHESAQTEVTADMHCVTRWSRFDIRWEGVPFTEVMKLAGAKPEAKYVMVLAEHGYTTNVPLEDLMRPTTIFALKHDGEELPPITAIPCASSCRISTRGKA